MFVSYSKTATEFRDEVVEELRRLAGLRRDASQRARAQNERAREGARANELATFAAFLESVQFHDKKPELTRTGDEAQPVFPHPEDFWPGGEKAT